MLSGDVLYDKPMLAVAHYLMELQFITDNTPKQAGKMLVLLIGVAVPAVYHTFMLKCLRPLPLLRPAGA